MMIVLMLAAAFCLGVALTLASVAFIMAVLK